MATEARTVAVVPLNGKNYPTWKVQCRMALMRDGLWDLASGKETVPAQTDAEKYAKFLARRDRALATIVLSVAPSLLYLIGDPKTQSLYGKSLLINFKRRHGPTS